MCGLVAMLSRRGPIDAERLELGMAALHHRGPDGRGRWISDDRSVGLGHTLLSIIDHRSGGQPPQPMASEDGRVQAIVNGELYGFEPIRAELERAGHRFSTGTDSEILVHLYQEHGLDCLAHLRGEYALVLWDQDRRRLFAARDPFGVKPLCYASQGGQLWIGSEAKALFAMGVRPVWDREALSFTLSMQYTPPGATLFKGVQQLLPGHYLLAEGDSLRVLRAAPPEFAPEAECFAESSFLEVSEELRRLLSESVALRLRADVPLACQLSGGLDSSAVLGFAAQHGARLPAFIASFQGESAYDERAIAEQSAAAVGASLHPVVMSRQALFDALPEAVVASEGVSINSHLAAKYLLHREVRRAGYKVILTGEGSDELFAGYPHLLRDQLLASGDLAALGRLEQSNRVSTGIMMPEGQALPLDGVRARLGFVPSFLAAKATLGFRLRGLLAPDFAASLADRDLYREAVDASWPALAALAPVDRSAQLWLRLAFSSYLLRTLGDGTEMPHGVEGRLPFLDPALFALVRRIPLAFKIRGAIDKHVLREAVRPVVTEAIYRRPKHPFMAPPLDDAAVLERVRSGAIAALPFFDPPALSSIAERLPVLDARERTAWDPVLMIALSLSYLAERFSPAES